MINLSEDKNLPIGNLTSIFNDTTNSYKFFWFLAILADIQDNNSEIILIENLNTRMLEDVWYPLNYYLLSFGKTDSYKVIADFINSRIEVDCKINSDALFNQIDKGFSPINKNEYKLKVKSLSRWVPYRFIRPFFANETRGVNDSQVNNKIKSLALETSKNNPGQCPYWFSEDKIIINRIWFEYFLNNIGLLRGFTYWHLSKFLQKNNPNVPGISEKLFKPTQRSLRRYIDGWSKFIELNPNERCIYSGNILACDFSIDHFIPWSFTANDLNWNLVPVSKQVNSSKGNRLPNLDKFLEPLSELQFKFFQTMFSRSIEKQILEDYCLLLSLSLNEISNLPKNIFMQKIKETISPMEQVAANMGFVRMWEL